MIPPTPASPKSPGLLDPAVWGAGMAGLPFREAVRKKTGGTLITRWWGEGQLQNVSLLIKKKNRVRRSVWAGLPAGEGWVEGAERKGAENRGRERKDPWRGGCD